MSSSESLTYHGLFRWFSSGIKMKLPLYITFDCDKNTSMRLFRSQHICLTYVLLSITCKCQPYVVLSRYSFCLFYLIFFKVVWIFVGRHLSRTLRIFLIFNRFSLLQLISFLPNWRVITHVIRMMLVDTNTIFKK